MPNVKIVISAHSKRILNEDATQENKCNCRQKTTAHSKENANQRRSSIKQL